MSTAKPKKSDIRMIYASLFYSGRFRLFLGAWAVIIAGLMLRRYGANLGFPHFFVKYGGSVLWGSMVYLLVATVSPLNKGKRAVIIASVIAMAVECFQLVHFPALDQFRSTTIGALFLGRVFSVWDIACYLRGIFAVTFIIKFCVHYNKSSGQAEEHE